MLKLKEGLMGGIVGAIAGFLITIAGKLGIEYTLYTAIIAGVIAGAIGLIAFKLINTFRK